MTLQQGCEELTDWPAFENSNAEYKREEKFVLFEQRSTNIAVDAVGEVLVQNVAVLCHIVAFFAHHDRLQQ